MSLGKYTLNIRLKCCVDSLSTDVYAFCLILDDEILRVLDNCALAMLEMVSRVCELHQRARSLALWGPAHLEGFGFERMSMLKENSRYVEEN